jgi:hypothetical protein
VKLALAIWRQYRTLAFTWCLLLLSPLLVPSSGTWPNLVYAAVRLGFVRDHFTRDAQPVSGPVAGRACRGWAEETTCLSHVLLG